MISSIKSWTFNKSLKGHRNFTSKSSFSGINPCIKICLVADGSIENSKNSTLNYAKRLRSLNRSVDMLFYYDVKEEITDGYSKQDIRWNDIPQNEIIDQILGKEYDLLMFLCPTMENHSKYLAILCNAKFKIGPNFEEHNHIFDLLIDIPDFGNTDQLIKNIDNQLKILSV